MKFVIALKNIEKFIVRALNFLLHDIWRIKIKETEPHNSILINCLRVTVLSIKEFQRDKCQIRASALTYYTLLSIVPLLAMAFGIAKGFGFQQRLETLIYDKISGTTAGLNVVPTADQSELFKLADKIVGFAKNALDNTSGGFIAGIGIIFLLWAVIKLLGNIEHSFNAIWGIKKARHIGRKFTDYISFMLLAPILFIISSSFTVLIKTELSEYLAGIDFAAPIIAFFFSLTPFVLIWILFSFIFIFMPNTKVKLKSAIIAGIISGTIFQITLKLYLTFQFGVSNYNSIYGSFAALPLFLILLQISWVIVLYGAELSFAMQNVETYEFEADCKNISPAFKRLISLQIIEVITKRFVAEENPYSLSELGHKLEIPARLLREILFEMQNAHLIAEINNGKNGTPLYILACDPSSLSIIKVCNILDHSGTTEIPVIRTREMEQIQKHLAAINELMQKSQDNVILKDI